MPEAKVEGYASLFDSLAMKSPPIGRGHGRRAKKVAVRFGPTAAAKILFVLRPTVFVAWDEPIRAGLHYDGSGASYVRFLLRLREELLELQAQCRLFEMELTELPDAIGRPLSTPAQLMDEYYWATLTHGVTAPTRQQVARWLEWYTPPLEQPTLIVRGSALAAGASGNVVLVPPPGPTG